MSTLLNYLISVFRTLSQKSHKFKIINGQNISSGKKTRKLDTLAKLFQGMRRGP